MQQVTLRARGGRLRAGSSSPAWFTTRWSVRPARGASLPSGQMRAETTRAARRSRTRRDPHGQVASLACLARAPPPSWTGCEPRVPRPRPPPHGQVASLACLARAPRRPRGARRRSAAARLQCASGTRTLRSSAPRAHSTTACGSWLTARRRAPPHRHAAPPRAARGGAGSRASRGSTRPRAAPRRAAALRGCGARQWGGGGERTADRGPAPLPQLPPKRWVASASDKARTCARSPAPRPGGGGTADPRRAAWRARGAPMGRARGAQVVQERVVFTPPFFLSYFTMAGGARARGGPAELPRRLPGPCDRVRRDPRARQARTSLERQPAPRAAVLSARCWCGWGGVAGSGGPSC
jgi:hypothetical protein